MRISIIDMGNELKFSTHLTATEINHIKQMFENGLEQGGTKTKAYKIEKLDNGNYIVSIASKETYTIGRGPEWRTRKVMFELK